MAAAAAPVAAKDAHNSSDAKQSAHPHPRCTSLLRTADRNDSAEMAAASYELASTPPPQAVDLAEANADQSCPSSNEKRWDRSKTQVPLSIANFPCPVRPLWRHLRQTASVPLSRRYNTSFSRGSSAARRGRRFIYRYYALYKRYTRIRVCAAILSYTYN